MHRFLLQSPFSNPDAEAALPVSTYARQVLSPIRSGIQGLPGAELVDVYRCDQIARDIAEEKLGERTTMCGKCFAACPYTKAYIRRAKVHSAF